jgi:uncharacterized protein (DUF2147 family)
MKTTPQKAFEIARNVARRLAAIKPLTKSVGILIISLLPVFAVAQTTNPEGLWKNIDDHSGKPRSEIRIEIKEGVMIGKIVRSLRPEDDPAARCTECKGTFKDQPFVGMAILSGLTLSPSNPLLWEGGQILDPDKATLYRAKIQLAPNGKTLEMRGFIGAPLFGRTQTWYRVE